METTEEADPTITRPITQSSPTTTARTVPVGHSWTKLPRLADGAVAAYSSISDPPPEPDPIVARVHAVAVGAAIGAAVDHTAGRRHRSAPECEPTPGRSDNRHISPVFPMVGPKEGNVLM